MELTLEMFFDDNDEPIVHQIEETIFLPWSLNALSNLKGLHDDIAESSGELGTISKLIRTNGVPGTLAYLNRLVTDDGQIIKYKRVCSMPIEGLKTSVDMWELKSVDGKLERTLCFDMYNLWRTTEAPDGMRLKPYESLTEAELKFLKTDVWNSTQSFTDDEDV